MKMMLGAFWPGLREEVAHARGPDADEHLHEVGAAQAEERHARLPGDALASSVFPVPGAPTRSTPLGILPAEPPIVLGRS